MSDRKITFSEYPVSRRWFNKSFVPGLLATVAVAEVTLTAGCSQENETLAEPEAVLNGEVLILKGTRVSLSQKTQFPALAEWERIVEVNGEKLQGSDGFLIKNPMVSFHPDLDQHGNRVPVIIVKGKVRHTEGTGVAGAWTVTRNNVLFITLGHENSRHVRFSAQSEIIPVSKTGEGFVRKSDGTAIAASEIAQVTTLSGKSE